MISRAPLPKAPLDRPLDLVVSPHLFDFWFANGTFYSGTVISVDTSGISAGPAILPPKERIQQLRTSLRKRTVQIRRLLRERGAIEAAAESDDGSTKPAARLAAIERELSKIIESRNAIGRELEDLLGAGQPESDEDYVPAPKAAHAVRLLSCFF